jgi:hypothetical protein
MIISFFLFSILIIFLQQFFDYLFFFLIPSLDYFFQKNNKKLIFNLFFLSLLTDFILLKPFGFFLVVSSLSFIIISLFEKILPFHFFYHKLIYLFIFNLSFISILFYFLGFNKVLLPYFLKVLLINFFIQSFYFLIKENVKLK